MERTKISIDEIIQLGESQSVEFKRSLSLQREACESLCAMINTDYGKGVVIFGVGPDNSIVGIEPGNLDVAQQSIVQHIRQHFDPQIICSIQIIECDDKTLLFLEANRNSNNPYHEYQGRGYIREGSANRILSISEKEQLTSRRNRDKHTGPWKCNRCGSITGMMMHMVITDEGVKKSYECECGGEFWPI